MEKKDINSVIDDKTNQFYLGGEGKILVFSSQGKLFPSLWLLRTQSITDLVIPSISIDKGATSHLLNGADLFAGGITEYDSFEQDDVVIIKNPSGFSICVGMALISAEELKKTTKGKVVKNHHWIGDKIWNFKY